MFAYSHSLVKSCWVQHKWQARVRAACAGSSLTFLLMAWFSAAEEAKRPICSGFVRFRPERKGVYTNRPENDPTEQCEKSVLVEDPGASGCARSGAGLPDEAFRRFARDSSS